jgi:hypothetical protein
MYYFVRILKDSAVKISGPGSLFIEVNSY